MRVMQRVLTYSMVAVFFVSGLGSLAPWSGSVLAQTGDPVFVGAGDIASCGHNRDESTAQLLDAIPGTVFTLGDNAYPDGTLTQFNDCYGPTWGRHKNRTKPAPGNHDYHVAGAGGYFDYFGAAAGDRSKGYYSYNLGDWHIISLNSEITQSAGSAQEQWLRADLAANPKVCTLAYWHKPRFSSGRHGNNAGSQALWQALYEYGADVVLNGHDHSYERFAPQNPSGQADAKGIREFVVGTGGAGLYPFPAIQPNSQVRNNTTYGVLKLTLHSTSYDWQFIPIAGQNFTDSGSGNCVTIGSLPTATRTPTAASGPTPTRTPTQTPTSTANTMHVGDLDGTSTGQSNRWTATITITVHDANHNPVANAMVSGTWSAGATGTGSCTTGSNGQCTVSKSGIRKGKSSVTFAVNNVTRTNFTYASSGNHDPDGSSNGTRIVVRKP
jgi:Bacterial Ig-like domain (group 1)/Calcineurin-like phosphoesterase